MKKPSHVSGETYVTLSPLGLSLFFFFFSHIDSLSPKNTSHFKMWLLVLATVSCCLKGVLFCRSSPMLWSGAALRLVSSVRHSHIQLMSVWCSETLTHSTTSHLEMAINSKMFQGRWSFLVVLSVSAPCLMHVHKVREKGSRSYSVGMFTRHLSKSFFSVLLASLLLNAQQYQAILQPVLWISSLWLSSVKALKSVPLKWWDIILFHCSLFLY